jgi:hypothetical protein
MITGTVQASPLPLVIGVTGHRTLREQDVVPLEEVVRGVIEGARQRYPHCPLVILSPLAEGADRLVARVALDLGARLIVPLPLPPAIYEQDFATEASRAEFHDLLSRAESVFELPILHGSSTAAIAERGEPRDRQYAQVGAVVARHSQIFIALWDGVSDGAGPGGTADIVRFRLEGAPGRYEPAVSPLAFASIGSVYHVVTPRPNVPAPDDALTLKVLVPPHQSDVEPADLPRWMDTFNDDARADPAWLAAAQLQSKCWLLGVEPNQIAEHTASLGHSAKLVLEHYSVADSLAVRYAAEATRATKWVFACVFVAALFFNLFHSLPHRALEGDAGMLERAEAIPWLLWAFLAVSLIGSLWLHRRAMEEDYQNKHQDYRALAEALRIQFFWRVAGLPNMVVDHYLRKQRGELEWIRNALRAWDVESMPHRMREEQTGPLAGRLAFVHKNWVAEQRNYYTRRAKREQQALEHEERRIETLVKLSVGLAMLLAALLTVPLLVHSDVLEEMMQVVESPWTHGLVMVSIVTIAVAAGLRHGYLQQMAYSEHAKQYGRMAELFNMAERHLAQMLQNGEDHHAAELLRELGEEALEENGDWVLLHRERPLEVPHSG